MGQALAQNATQLAVGTNGEQDFDISYLVSKEIERKVKGQSTTLERKTLNRNKVLTACVASYRAHFPAIYGKSDRLPSDIYDKIAESVDKEIGAQLNRINVHNALSFRRGFHHDSRGRKVTERVNITGENLIDLQQQRCGIVIFIEQAKKKLAWWTSKPTPDFDREKALKEQIADYEVTLIFIDREIEHQKGLQAKAN